MIDRDVEPHVPADWHRIDHARGLIEALHGQDFVSRIQAKTRFGQAVFARDCQPIVDAVAEYVQRLPTMPGPPGDALLSRALRVCDIALQLRLGELLPPRAAAEELHRREHRWTYGVFLTALLADLGNLCSSYRVRYTTGAGHQFDWRPWAGSLREMGASAYRIDQPDPTQQAQSASWPLAFALFARIVPQPVLRWLAEDVELMDCLCATLCAEPDGNPIGILVQHARNEAARRAPAVAQRAPIDRSSATTANHRNGQDSLTPAGLAQSNTSASPAMSSAQGDLFIASAEPIERSDARPQTSAQHPRSAWLLSITDSLSPLLKDTLASIESDLQARATTPIQIHNEYGFLVSLEEFERYGTDIGFAITSLSKAGMLLASASEPGKTIHTLQLPERTGKAVVIRAHRSDDSFEGQKSLRIS